MKLSRLLLALLFIIPAAAYADPALIVHVDGIDDSKPIPDKFAHCTADGKGATKNGENVNPTIRWSGAPEGTKSYVILVVDRDVPASFERANQAGKTIPNDFARQDFYHWVLIDIPANITSIDEGKDSRGIVEGGKNFGQTGYGVSGQNDYSKMQAGNWGGYDGPCPPWNDERIHRYHFIVYALNIESLNMQNPVNGKQVEELIVPHTLAKGEIIGTYTNNPKLIGK